MSFRPSDNFSSSRSSDQRFSDEQYEILSCNQQTETFDQSIQTDFPLQMYSIDEIFSQSTSTSNDIAVQTSDFDYLQATQQLQKLGLANKQLAMRNIELEGQLQEAKEKIKIFSRISRNELIKENDMVSMKEMVESYKNEQRSITQFLNKSLGLAKNAENKSLKCIIESIFVELTQNLQEISRELTLIRVMSSEETLEKVEMQKKEYNHWGQIRKITEIKENIIKLHHRIQKKK